MFGYDMENCVKEKWKLGIVLSECGHLVLLLIFDKYFSKFYENYPKWT